MFINIYKHKMEQNSVKVSDQQIIEIFKSNKTLHKCAAELNMTNVTLWRRAKKLGLKWSEKKISFNRVPLWEILEGMHPHFQTFKLKNKLLAEGIFENRCDICGLDEWNGKPLNSQLDHIDGDSHNHKLENLRMICPNCHSQTDTFCGKKRKHSG
jgi:hypothetical protein